MFLLKGNKLFVTNLSTIFILGILIYHIQLYESSKLLVLAMLRHYQNSRLVDLVSRTIFGPKLAAILDFETLGDQETIFNQLYHILHPQKHMFRDKVCGSVIIRSWGMEYPIFSFSYFFSWRPL